MITLIRSKKVQRLFISAQLITAEALRSDGTAYTPGHSNIQTINKFQRHKNGQAWWTITKEIANEHLRRNLLNLFIALEARESRKKIIVGYQGQ